MSSSSYIEGAKKGKEAKGKSAMLKFLAGKRLTLGESVKAYCYDCMGFYVDGKEDCQNEVCPLHPFMAYNPNRRKLVEREVPQKKAA